MSSSSTSYDLPEYREAAYRYGANYFLAKGTTNGQKLLGLIESILSDLGFDAKDAKSEDIGPTPEIQPPYPENTVFTRFTSLVK